MYTEYSVLSEGEGEGEREGEGYTMLSILRTFQKQTNAWKNNPPWTNSSSGHQV